MRRLFLQSFAVALILTATTTAISAQPPRPNTPEQREQIGEARGEREKREELTPEEKAIKMTEKMTRNLNLTEAQAKKIYKVNLDYVNALIEAQKIKSKHKLNILDVLDDDQSIEYLDMLAASQRKRDINKAIQYRNPSNKGQRGRQGGRQGGENRRSAAPAPAAPATK